MNIKKGKILQSEEDKEIFFNAVFEDDNKPNKSLLDLANKSSHNNNVSSKEVFEEINNKRKK